MTLTPTKRALLEQRLRGRSTRTIPALPDDAPPPLSFAQERFWFLEQLAPGNTAAVIPIVLRLLGDLDADRLAAAISAVVARHEPLRSRFVDGGDGRPRLRIDEAAPVPLPLLPLEALEAHLAEPFDLAAGGLLRPALVKVAQDDHLLAIAVHHIVTDGWSMDLFASEVAAHYRGGTPPELPVRYRDYAAWQRANTGFAASVAFWRDGLAGVEPLDLPTDHPRPARQTFTGAEHSFPLGLRDELPALSRDHGVTLHMTLLAAFQAVLGRLSGQTDFAVGSPVAGRQPPELERLIGMFVNTVAVRAPLSGDPTFAELLGRVKEGCLDAYAHQDLPFEQLVQELNLPRDVRRSPIFQALFALQNYDEYDGRDWGGLTLGHWPAPVSATRFELELYVKEAPGELWATVVYNTDLFSHDTAVRFAGHFRRFLAEVAADPHRRLSDVDLLEPDERAVVLPAPEPVELPETTVPALIEARMAAQPDAVALTFAGRHMTYGELDEHSARLAARIPRGALVAVSMDRSFELVVALLAVLRAGAAYVPLDPEYPAERLAFMREDCAALDLDAALAGGGSPLEGPGPGDIAYVIYTSGSTGRPKGVPNTHRGLLNRLDWMQRRFGIGPGDAVLQKTPAGFDVSVWEFFWPLMTGARLVLAEPGGHRDAEYLRDLIRAEQVTTLHFVPSMLAVFLATEGVAACTSLRTIVCSGEALPADLARRCVATLPAELHNLYGPTEAAIDVSAWRCDGDALAGRARVPIGAAVQNVALYVLDERLRPAPVGVPGQLYIAGVQLATGYLGRPALTAEKFRPDPYGPPGSRMYATGDAARRLPDGTIDFLGRLDTQVKLRGLRIELGEIETAIRARPGVEDAAVVVRDERLVAYVVGSDDDVRPALKRSLPDYMVPAAFVRLDALPLTPNGKLDRRALPAPTVTRSAAVAFAEPSTDAERLVAGIWQELLGVEKVGADDDFFDLGGHSLVATQVVARLRKAGGGVSVLDVFQYKTVRELARLLSEPDRGPRRLLHELTRPVPPGQRLASIVAVPYGGGSAVVYQPLADALPAGWSLHAVAIPGQDIGVREEALPFDELAARLTAEVLERVEGPLVVYGHCGVGSSVAVELARRLEAAGRTVEAVYIGAVFPFARPTGRFSGLLAKLAGREALLSNRVYENWLRSMGVEMAEFDRDEADLIIRNMREHTRLAEEYFTGLFAEHPAALKAPIVSVVGSQDTQTEFYRERYREWHFLTGTTALVVLDEAGHFFLKYRAGELAHIVTEVHGTDERLRDPDGGWEVAARSSTVRRADGPDGPEGPEPSLGRFMAVATGQLVSIVGSALTEFAIPLWIYLQTGSLVRFAVFAVLGLVPGMLVAPFAGAVVDRFDRRKVMLGGDLAAGASQAALLALALTGTLRVSHVYGLLVVLSVALTFQRLAFSSAVPQLVPKRYLGHANGMVQLSFGAGQFLVPLVAAGLMATVGLRGVLVLDVVSYVVAVGVTLAVRFPRTLAWARRETFWQEVVGGWRYALGAGSLRPVLVFFAVLNLFMTPLFLLLSPLVLSFADLGAVARVSMAGGLGAVAGGLLMSFWGGPRRHRVRGMLLVVLGLALSSALPGLRPSELLVAAGALGMSLGLTLANGVYTTIVQVKVPQRFHGRVFAVNTVIAFSTIPIGYAVVAPLGSRLLDPLLAPHGALAGSLGALIGTGPGRGTALLFLLLAAVMVAQVLVSLRLPSLARFDERVPDAAPDDLIGAQVRQRRKEQAHG
nr:hypothetical protein GCM10020063_077880 [Dactylosporangium thailandense]